MSYFDSQKKEIKEKKNNLNLIKEFIDNKIDKLNDDYKKLLKFIKNLKKTNKKFELKQMENLKISKNINVNYEHTLNCIKKINSIKHLLDSKFKNIQKHFLKLKNDVNEKRKEIYNEIIFNFNELNKDIFNEKNEQKLNVNVSDKNDNILLNIKRTRDKYNKEETEEDPKTEEESKEAFKNTGLDASNNYVRYNPIIIHQMKNILKTSKIKY